MDDEEIKLLIMDVTKNYWDRGLDLCKKISGKIEKKQSILVLSSEFLNERIQMYHQAGADSFLVKPFAKSEIVRSIEKLLS